MESAETQLQEALKQAGYSLTAPRLSVFRALLNKEPQSMGELIKAAEGDRASIYRVVQLFEKLGIITRIQIGWKYKLELSDAYSHHHHHMTCLKCGLIIAVPENDTLELLIKSVGIGYGFTIVDHQFELRGLCQACQQKKTPTV